MPVIRLAEIPNAGPRAVPASGANISLPKQPGFVVDPKAVQLDGAATIDPSSFNRGARSMIAQTLEQNAFSAEAEAGYKFGSAVQGLGQAAQNIGEQWSKAKDTADLARAEMLMVSAFQKQQNDQIDLPIEKWQGNWAQHRDTAKKAIGELKLSNNAMARLMPSWERWSGMSEIQISGQARQKTHEGYIQDVEANSMMKVANGDLAGAIAIWDEAARSGMVTPSYAKLKKAQLADNQFAQARENNVNRLVADSNADPDRMIPLFESRARGEEVPELGSDVTPIQAAGLATNARGIKRTRLAEKDDAAVEAYSSGNVKDAKELREKFPGLPESRYLVHEAAIAKIFEASPENMARVKALRPKYMTAIDLYDSTRDDTELTRYLEIKDAINGNLPPGERKELLDALSEKLRERKRVPQGVTDALETFDKLADAGWGSDFTPVDEKKLQSSNEAVRIAEATKLNETGAWHSAKRDELLEWAKENPKDARDPAKVTGKVQSMLSGKADKRAFKVLNDTTKGNEQRMKAERPAQGFGQSYENLPMWHGGETSPQFGAPKEDGEPKEEERLPASIRNNNAGAMWPAEWQKKFGGTFGENLADGKGNKIAKFPSPVHGAAATMYLLGAETLRYSKKTIRDGIKLWSNASGKGLQAYVSAFEDAGFSADDNIGDIMADQDKAVAFTKIMSGFEAGREFPLDEDGWAEAYRMFIET